MSGRRSRHADLDSYEATVSSTPGTVELLEPRFSAAAPSPTTHKVQPGERPDHLAHRYFGHADAFFRLADENLPRDPDDLGAAGTVLRIPEDR